MSEEAPNVLPQEKHDALMAKIDEAAEITQQADAIDERYIHHYGEVDSSNGRVELLGETVAPHHLKRKAGGGRIDVNIRDRKPGVKRNIHSFSDRRGGPWGNITSTELDVKREGKERKVLRSDNPVVYNMLADIALRDIKANAQAEIDKEAKRKAA